MGVAGPAPRQEGAWGSCWTRQVAWGDMNLLSCVPSLAHLPIAGACCSSAARGTEGCRCCALVGMEVTSLFSVVFQPGS